ncbi:hypothetical protein [Nannocystis sp. SCPEA4]|uniref:hypothetical protein n=1 Tax=Nannocystis sp. SCPEA4 TaxID=2996787 RepID=UPI0022718A9B|nr:hypothetical protein [Nannocystis sp. SCPEA4]MCY1058368.1 hypothetical protein [Nannocystis sp. SCPEA4]
MRRPTRSPGLCIVLLAACAVPNPAYHVTQGLVDSSSGDTLGATDGATQSSGSATGEPTTTDGGTQGASSGASTTNSTSPTATSGDTEDTAATTQPATTSPGTTDDTSAATSTSDGSDATSMAASDTVGPSLDLGMPDLCSLQAAPDLGLAVQHSPMPNCLGLTALTLMVEGKPDDHTLKFRECLVGNDCLNGNEQCAVKQTVVLKIDGPASHVPDLEPGTCVNLAYLPTGLADANTCSSSLVRIGKTGANIKTTSVYAAADGVPATGMLPPPWPEILGFSVTAELVAPCVGGEVCGQPTGNHDLVGQAAGVEVAVPMQTEKPLKLPLLDKQNNKIGDVTGGLFNLRSYAVAPAQCEFDWIWIADEVRP